MARSPSIDDLGGETMTMRYETANAAAAAHLVCIAGPLAGRSFELGDGELAIGRAASCQIHIDAIGVSRMHAQITRDGDRYLLEDVSANGTLVNGVRVVAPVELHDGDRIQIGPAVLRFGLGDADAASFSAPELAAPWSLDSWRAKPIAQDVAYDDTAKLERVVERLRRMPPLVTSWEIEALKQQLAEAQDGRRFLLQGGDCAETFAECASDVITNKLKILIQMSLVLLRGIAKPIVRVGRFAGQYAKPRSSMTERRGGVELPSYFGDLVNRPEFTAEARRPDPELLLAGYHYAGVTLNFIRSLSDGRFADLRRREHFDLAMHDSADLPAELKREYQRIAKEVSEGVQLATAVQDGAAHERRAGDLMKVRFFTSHEGLNLHYEAAQTRRVPRREGFYDLSTHLPWIGERTRARDGAHVEFFRGIANPIAIKVGPRADPDDIVALTRILDPRDEPGKIVLITRLGAANVAATLPALIAAIRRARRRVLWVSDPMHGNGLVTQSGIKTRNFDDILRELELTIGVHDGAGSVFGGVHFELTGEDVTECTGAGLVEADLSRNYATMCDPRLNYRQAIQMAFALAERLRGRQG